VTVVRSLIYVALFYLWTAFIAILCTPVLLGPRRVTLAMFHFWGRGVTAMLVICGIRVEVRGQQFIPTGPALVAPKHQCMLDVFAQFTWLPATAFVMKQELAWIPWFGWYARKAGAIVIDRAGASKTMR
jgi:1-acyl-sn-glycerol-3-phosphate acyltransferase